MSLIPKKIFQSWKTKNLPPKMQENVQKIRELNPEYEYHLFDDNDCREFLLKHFGVNYANAFDELIPGAFKCDFWRYAVMYIIGGVYIDMDMTPLVPFREMFSDKDEFVSVVDYEWYGFPGIYQAFIACRTGHPIMRDSIDLAFYNIASKRSALFTIGSLSITGPGVVAIATNLFLNQKNTTTSIKPGVYNSLRLFAMDMNYTYGVNKEKFFQNKFKGYKGSSYTGKTYMNDPTDKMRKISKFIVILFVVILVYFCYRGFKTKQKLTQCQDQLL